MSIFKDTFPPFVCRQLNARQDLVNISGHRPIEVQQFTTAKSPWVKMASFVNYDNEAKGYKGDALARKYVLEGGTLFPDSNDDEKFRLRYGVGRQSSAYGGNLGNRQYGLIPMPGIAGLEVKSKSAYGSLREATVRYVCWDKKQLDELEILYMRPGYTVLLEWGWSMYLDTYDSSDIQHMDISQKLGNHTLMKAFNSPTINPFQPGITQDDMYQRIKDLQEKFSGNYEGCIGKIMNFSYTLMPNGGYECTTVLISIGEVLDTLKMNSSTGVSYYDETKKDYKTEFELLMEKFKTVNNTADPLISGLKQPLPFPEIDTVIQRLGFNVQSPSFKDHNDGEYYYIQLAYFIHILNERYNLYSGDTKLLNLEIPVYSKSNIGNGLCLGSEFSVTVDPEVCLIRNPRAKFLTRDNKGFNLIADRISPETAAIAGVDLNGMKEYLLNEKDTKLGIIGNIYLSIDMICAVYRNISRENKGSVGIGMLIKGILDNLSFALGSINDFDIYVQENNAVIIDKCYTEFGKDAAYDTKFELNLIGKNSINEQINLVSKIFPNQSTLVAIAAGVRNNIAGVQSSTNVYLNAGITDRLIRQSVEWTASQEEEERKNVRDEMINGNISLIDYVSNHLMKGDIPDSSSKTAANSFLNSLILKLSNDANYRAIIPLCLDVTMDGISGVVIGQIFTINKDALPSDYADKKIGFIVTSIAHTMDGAKWKTTLGTMICLLDQDNISRPEILGDSFTTVNDTNKAINDQQVSLNTSIAYYRLLAAFIKDFCSDILTIKFENTANADTTNSFKSIIGNLTAINPKLDYINNPAAVKEIYIAVNETSVLASFYYVMIYFGNVIGNVITRNPDITNKISGIAQKVATQLIKTSLIYDENSPILKVLTEVVHSSTYYINMTPEVKSIFDDQYKGLMEQFKSAGEFDDYQFKVLSTNSINTSGKFTPVFMTEKMFISSHFATDHTRRTNALPNF